MLVQIDNYFPVCYVDKLRYPDNVKSTKSFFKYKLLILIKN